MTCKIVLDCNDSEMHKTQDLDGHEDDMAIANCRIVQNNQCSSEKPVQSITACALN